jgi:Rieske Fe-S protein
MSDITSSSNADPCTTCSIGSDRRRFLRDAFAAVTGALVALGANRRSVMAMPLALIEPVRTAGDLKTYPIPSADGAQLDHDAEVILVRWESAVYAFYISCPHQRTVLRWSAPVHEFQCPKHHSRYRPDGTFIDGRATRGLDRFALRRDGAHVLVDLDRLFQEDVQPAEWKAAVVTVA